MLVYFSIPILTIFICLTCQKTFKKISQIDFYYSRRLESSLGGIIIFISMILSFTLLYCFDKLTQFKLYFYVVPISFIVLVCFVKDLIGEKKICSKMFSVKSIVKIGDIIISFYIYYCFNEEYWLLKGLITYLFIDYFTNIDLNSKQSEKVIWIYFFTLSVFYLRWTKDLYIVTLLVLISFNFYTRNRNLSLSRNGAGLIGLIFGFISSEAFFNNLGLMLMLIISLLTSRYKIYKDSKPNLYCYKGVESIITKRKMIKVVGDKYNK
jgi:hypothetical protein